MFSAIKRLLGDITVIDKGDRIIIDGVDSEKIIKAIALHWKSKSIPEYLISKRSRYSLTIDAFFAPDFLFTLRQIASSGRSLKVSIKIISKIHAALLKDSWLGKTEEEHPTRLNLSKLKELQFSPKPYQEDFLHAYDQLTQQFRLSGFLLNGAAGSGKTAASLMLAQCLEKERVIIVCPKNAVYQVWASHMTRVFKQEPSSWIADTNKPYTGEKFLIVHYEKLEALMSMVNDLSPKNTMVILDESHNLNTPTSLRTEMFLSFCKGLGCTDVLWMSGTPFKAVTKEAIPLFRSIDPQFNEDVEFRFKKIYRDTHDRGVEIIRHRLGLVSFKIEKKELKLLPPIFEDIRIRVSNGERYTLENIKAAMRAFVIERTEYYKSKRAAHEAVFYEGIKHHEKKIDNSNGVAYEQYRRSLKTVILSGGDFSAADDMRICNLYELKEIYPNLPNSLRAEWRDVRSAVKYPKLKIQGECLGRILGGFRIDAHVAMVEQIDFLGICDSTKKKTVVFSTFAKVLEKVDEVLSKTELSPLFVYGKYTTSLKSIVTRFEKEEDINPLCASYAALSTAVPLVMADTMILIDSPYRDYVLQQAVSRIHRLDADTQTYIYRCELDTGEEPNISSRSVDILKWSQDQTSALTGTVSPYAISDSGELTLKLEGYDTDMEIKATSASW